MYVLFIHVIYFGGNYRSYNMCIYQILKFLLFFRQYKSWEKTMKNDIPHDVFSSYSVLLRF